MMRAAIEAPSHEERAGYEPGRVLLGRYELKRPLAVGGMGVVWIAHNRVLDVEVAVKLTLSGTLGSSDGARERALSEARLAAQLAHPAVCRVLDFGLTEEEDPFVVTELLRGETLEEVLALEGKMSAVEAVQVILPILDALSAAHEKGIVHRDVKPANVYLSRDAGKRVQPKLLDFGIARGQNQEVSWAASGTVSGTPCYMSPEQACGSDVVDLRSDIWSTCATLYELLTAAPPFEGDTCAAVLANVIDGEPIVPAEGTIDPWLWAILVRGFEKAPEKRWASAAELSSELARWLLALGVEADVCGHSLRTRLRDRGVGLASTFSTNTPGEDATLESPGSGPRRIRRSSPLKATAFPIGRIGAAAGGLVLSAVVLSAFAVWRSAATPPAVPASRALTKPPESAPVREPMIQSARPAPAPTTLSEPDATAPRVVRPPGSVPAVRPVFPERNAGGRSKQAPQPPAVAPPRVAVPAASTPRVERAAPATPSVSARRANALDYDFGF